MTRTAILGATAVALALGATAASANQFDGAYIGLQAGYGWGDGEQPFSNLVGGPIVNPSDDVDLDGFIGGAHAGYDWTFGTNMVFGVVGEVNFSDLQGDDNFRGGDNNEIAANWQGALRARLGVMASPSTLIYVTGGWAFLDADFNVTDPGEQESDSATLHGWTLGLGADMAFGANTTLGLAYRYTDYGEERVSFPVNTYDIEAAVTTSEVMVTYSWHF